MDYKETNALTTHDLIWPHRIPHHSSAGGLQSCVCSNVHRPLQRNWIPAAVRESDDDDVMTKFSGRSSTPMKTGQLDQVLPADSPLKEP
ncbi:hypothetical protein QQF64_024387 [Cirrhinus molitorella]|uniref:Prolactin receptor n=1 Tax=Cirrhinus molitorella TaxID=172907 RepID=A0ABR3NLD7_9TELE